MKEALFIWNSFYLYVSGFANPLDYEPSLDGLPYTTLLYGNGPGYKLVNESRENITGYNTSECIRVSQV